MKPLPKEPPSPQGPAFLFEHLLLDIHQMYPPSHVSLPRVAGRGPWGGMHFQPRTPTALLGRGLSHAHCICKRSVSISKYQLRQHTGQASLKRIPLLNARWTRENCSPKAPFFARCSTAAQALVSFPGFVQNPQKTAQQKH